MLLGRSGWGVLRHDAHQAVGDVGLLQIGALVRRQLYIHGFRRAVHMVQLRRARDRRGYLRHQPRQGHFGHRHAARVRYLGHAVNYNGVLLRRGVILEPGVIVLDEALARFAGVL